MELARVARLGAPLLGLAALLLVAPPGHAARAPATAGGADVAAELSAAACSPTERSEALDAHRAAVLAAPTLAEAQRRALEPTETARGALSRARWLAPFSDDLRDAEARLARYERAVREADTREAVADELDGLVQVAGGVDVDVNGGCHFSTGEVIAIVLGFILGIIPGIILLILLC